ncbi:hypothetical protein VNO77_23748 [Canavalia gladiata]|uniref:Uncharacterized protein n=1 Tax=Canavalia gladiata TaxID=3824 RepID=A0AAN9L8B8_CANGL
MDIFYSAIRFYLFNFILLMLILLVSDGTGVHVPKQFSLLFSSFDEVDTHTVGRLINFFGITWGPITAMVGPITNRKPLGGDESSYEVSRENGGDIYKKIIRLKSVGMPV